MHKTESVITRKFEGIVNYMQTEFIKAREGVYWTRPFWVEDLALAGKWVSNHHARVAIMNHVPERNQHKCEVWEMPR